MSVLVRMGQFPPSLSIVSLGLAWLAELGQVLSESRTPDSFDALLACGSMLAGYAVCRPRDV